MIGGTFLQVSPVSRALADTTQTLHLSANEGQLFAETPEEEKIDLNDINQGRPNRIGFCICIEICIDISSHLFNRHA